MAASTLPLTGRVAMVTGAGRGIGKSAAARLAGNGATVVVVDRDAEAAERAAREIASTGARVAARTVDVAQREQVDDLVRLTSDELGRIDILVNNAGVAQTRHGLELSSDDIDRVFRVNVRGVLWCMQAVAPQMIKQKYGRIVNLASIAGKTGSPYSLHYNASKAAVISMTRSAALDLARHSVTVNAVCPGYVDTDLSTQVGQEYENLGLMSADERQRASIAQIPLGRMTTPDEVSGVIAFLASDDAAYMTGQAINFTGGWMVH